MQILQQPTKTNIFKTHNKSKRTIQDRPAIIYKNIIEYTIKAKFFDKPPKIRKSDLSPNRIISTGRKKGHISPSPSRTKQNRTKKIY